MANINDSQDDDEKYPFGPTSFSMLSSNYDSKFSIQDIKIYNPAAEHNTKKFIYGQGGRLRTESSNFQYRPRINSDSIRFENIEANKILLRA